MNEAGLNELERRLARDLSCLCYPPENWVVPRRRGNEPVSDAVIVGGGMCGMVAWFALQRAGIRNIRILDRSPEGLEGPWLTYARMETLRSPKQLVGPASSQPSLTFQAWYRAQFGDAAWEALDRIPRPMWMDYLRWYRKVLGIPIENGVSLDRVEPEDGLLRLHLSGAADGSILARKLVMATGRDGTGAPAIPAFVEGLDRAFWAHSSDQIDFAALKGRRVAVVGVGASAVDNAAEALEAGAAEVRHLIRRPRMPVVNKLMGIGSYGFTAAYAQMSDEWRWRFMNYSFVTQTPPPRGSTLRVSRHPNAYFHFGKAVASVRQQGQELRIDFADGTSLATDFLILGTGFTVDPLSRTEFGGAADKIQLWRDVYTPPPGEESRELGLFPYLNPDFTFREATPGAAPWLGHVHCFNFGSTVSLGKVSGDIPAVSEGGVWLAREMAATLYKEDIATHWQGLQDYARPELLGDEWTPSDLPQGAEPMEVSR
ncbi:NAD(P)-binding domain-containing protein [Paracoccus siganidrum]|uniref:NAD(P)/FAD-dependent oxidoreductase n=1 Tax=Paracoccus siganidrum TaxID=1276757 RepID=A0A419A9T6_9RHOB|nr:NAD(P)/FAD-dependent oxidoreductase [Paracoccus siganidrum]RJL19662.1 NAD(P)/FAD-dependent oxidoreductase [Paracoccus siganidrum]RMC35955.1 FAD-dependent oxidoreductase [Paracoccus siganidrum]